MSNAALAPVPYKYDSKAISPAARRILRRANRTRCVTGKKTYPTVRKARIALDTLQRDEQRRQTALGQEARVERSVYPCRHGDHYHLTSQS